MEDRLAFDQRRDRPLDAGAGLELELARLELALAPVEERVELEQEGLVDHALPLQEGRDLARPRVARDQHDLVPSEASRLVGLPVDLGHADEDAERDDNAEGQHAAHRREQASARRLDPERRRRRGRGLQRLARAPGGEADEGAGADRGGLGRNDGNVFASAEHRGPSGQAGGAGRGAPMAGVTLARNMAKWRGDAPSGHGSA